MALETAAAIIGILAAAGKVAEILGPAVSAFRDVTKHAAAVLPEVNSSRIILSALQKYLDDLGNSPRKRKELIQIDQLICTLSDGVLIFSALEKLVVDLTSTGNSNIRRARWAISDGKFVTLISRMQCFKSSIAVMLNILQCESDSEAFQCHQELLSLTAALKKSNHDLSERLTRLESRIDASNFTVARRRGSVAATVLHHTDEISITKDDDTHVSIDPPMFQGLKHPFEKVLFSSRVYHKAKRKISNEPLRSSVRLSHAWTALSDVSLSDISCISVVALPLHLKDISNRQHYSLGQLLRKDITLRMDFILDKLSLELESNQYAKAPQPIAAQLADALEHNAEAFVARGIVVKGSQTSNPRALVEKFAEYSEPCTHPGVLSTRYGTGFGRDTTVRLRINIAGDGPLPLRKTRADMDRHQSAYAFLFVLLYDASSKKSLVRIENYYDDVLRDKLGIGSRTLIVCLTRGLPHELQSIGEGSCLADSFGAGFKTLRLDDVQSINAAFNAFVSSNWVICVGEMEPNSHHDSSPPLSPKYNRKIPFNDDDDDEMDSDTSDSSSSMLTFIYESTPASLLDSGDKSAETGTSNGRNWYNESWV